MYEILRELKQIIKITLKDSTHVIEKEKKKTNGGKMATTSHKLMGSHFT